MYTNFINEFIRELCLPLKDADVRKFANTLSTLANEKQKQIREKEKPKKKVLKGMLISLVGILVIILSPIIIDGRSAGFGEIARRVTRFQSERPQRQQFAAVVAVEIQSARKIVYRFPRRVNESASSS